MQGALQQAGRSLGAPVLEGVVIVAVLPLDLDLALTPVHLLDLVQQLVEALLHVRALHLHHVGGVLGLGRRYLA